MKKLFLLVATVLCAAAVSAQTTVDSRVIKVDLGLGSAIGGLPIGASYEQGIVEFGNGGFITVGGYLGFCSSSDSYVTYKWKRSQLNIMAQGNYYLTPLVDKMDFYAGLRLGYANISSNYVFEDGTKVKYDWGSPFDFSIHIGTNYWFNESIAVNAELGYGIAYFNIGAAFKF
ncbi:MAG: hypothetical protein SNH63_06020 [Rikenellaceae bacterium]